jgi:putative ABC transport system permease protein
MGLPLVYNIESVRQRWATTIVAVIGIAGSVSVCIAVLALASGFRAALVSSGSPDNAMVRRNGATSEMDSVVTLDQVRALEDAPEVEKEAGVPLVSPEIVVVANLPLRSSGTDANVQIRGVNAERALKVHRGIRMREGRFIQPAMFEVVVGKHAALSYSGMSLGEKIRLGGTEWTIVGVMDAGGSSFDSEVWCDSSLLAPVYHRPREIFQSTTVRLTSQDMLSSLASKAEGDPRLQVQVERETDYYARASERFESLVRKLGSLVAAVMAIGAIFAALNTMYSAVAERGREIATIRALGFGQGAVVVSFLFEALLIAFTGGVIGALCALPLNGLTTGTMNWQTFSHLSFAFRVTPNLLGLGLVFALVMGILGGLPPALRAARLPITVALRDL